MLITPYTSQTTAYILDVMKTLAIHNLNEYTFVPFKTMSMAGIDYDTALSILYQPIIDTLVRNVNESQGFGVKSGSNPLVETFVSIAERAGIKNANNIILLFQDLKNFIVMILLHVMVILLILLSIRLKMLVV